MRDQTDTPGNRESADPGWPTLEQAAPFSTHAVPLPDPPSDARATSVPAMPEPAEPPSADAAPAAGPTQASIGDTLNPQDTGPVRRPPSVAAPADTVAPGTNSAAPAHDDDTPGHGGGDQEGSGKRGAGESGGGQSGGGQAGGGRADGGHGGGDVSGSGESRGRWEVDLDRLQEFAVAVAAARTGLGAVQTLVTRMQGEDYTPKLGTSPVGKQLARKFDDRLNSEAGLRPLLAEAVRRMDDFIHSAESVRDAYAEAEAEAEAVLRQAGQGGQAGQAGQGGQGGQGGG